MNCVLKNVRPVTPEGTLSLASVLIRDGKIADLDYKGDTHDAIDGEGGYLLAGFVDLHLHGGGGADFMDATPEAFAQAIKTHLLHGTTSLYPTAMTAPEAELNAFIDDNYD